MDDLIQNREYIRGSFSGTGLCTGNKIFVGGYDRDCLFLNWRGLSITHGIQAFNETCIKIKIVECQSVALVSLNQHEAEVC